MNLQETSIEISSDPEATAPNGHDGRRVPPNRSGASLNPQPQLLFLTQEALNSPPSLLDPSKFDSRQNPESEMEPAPETYWLDEINYCLRTGRAQTLHL